MSVAAPTTQGPSHSVRPATPTMTASRPRLLQRLVAAPVATPRPAGRAGAWRATPVLFWPVLRGLIAVVLIYTLLGIRP